MITTGYIGYPPTDGRATLIQVDPTAAGFRTTRASCILTTTYWPAGTEALGRRDTFADQGMAYSYGPGSSLTLPYAEAAALVAAGAARWS